jgi:hypothetical protein
MTATVCNAASGIDGHAGKGLEMFQAIIEHFIPSAIVNLASIFREWNVLHQEKNKLAVAFSSRVAKLAGPSKRAGQESTESSQILTFVEGLLEGFADFSGRLSVADTTLHNATALAKTLQLSMDKMAIAPWTQESCQGRAKRANGAIPNNAAADVSLGPLSRAQVDELFANFKCPLPQLLQLLRFRGPWICHLQKGSKKEAGASRRVGAAAATTPNGAPTTAPDATTVPDTAPDTAPADAAPVATPGAGSIPDNTSAPTKTIAGAGYRRC